ncbi:AAA family ATPase [Nitrospinota bacterium]
MNVASLTTDDLVSLLSDPAAYDPPPWPVRVVQTHGSCVFLASVWAYKMKKAVHYEFFDFSTPGKRRAVLQRELMLNRRLARGISRAAGVVLHRLDPLRKVLAGMKPGDPAPEPWEEGVYSEEMTGGICGELLERAGCDLRNGRDVGVDASFSRRAERERFADLTRREGARLMVVECVCPAGERRARLERRAAPGISDSDGRIEIMDSQAAGFGPVEELARIAVDTSGPKGTALAAGLRALYAA